jgi:hypothetical protein
MMKAAIENLPALHKNPGNLGLCLGQHESTS